VKKSTYPEYRKELSRLAGKLRGEIPATMNGFNQMNKEAMADGELARKHKELIAVGIAVAARCEGCLAFHVRHALHAGASRAEIVEAIGVAVMMGGGPAVMYACEALQALDEFENEPTD